MPATHPPDPALRERLTHERNVWLSTVRPNGTPHMTPVWFVFRDGTWWIGADMASVKVRNIEKLPKVSLALEDGRYPVVAEGTARLHRAPFPEDIKQAFATKYTWDITAPRTPTEPRALLEVPTHRWLMAGTAQ